MRSNKFDDILNVLKFDKMVDNELYLKNHLNYISALFGKHCEFLSKKSLRKFIQLSDKGKARLILSPNVSETLYLLEKGDDVDNLYTQLERFISAEGALEGIGKATIPFTSMSDYCFEKELNYKKVELINGILIDYNGLFHTESRGYTYGEALEFKEVLDEAFAYIQNNCLNTYEFILSNTIMISLFKDSNRFQTNFSSDISIGKIHSFNFENFKDDFDDVVDFLIHESIHNYLHLVEESVGQFLPTSLLGKEVGKKMAKSPWTGNMICPQSYTHAICVWFGLAKFWNKCEQKELMYNESVKGFQENKVLSGLSDFKEYLDDDYIKIVEAMSKELGIAYVS